MNTDPTENKFYTDDPEIIATFLTNGREIKLRTSPEYEAFMDSLNGLLPECMFQQSIWLQQMSVFLANGVRGTPHAIGLRGRVITPASTPEAVTFVDSLQSQQFDLVQRQAVAALLSAIAKQLYCNALDRDPSLIPEVGKG